MALKQYTLYFKGTNKYGHEHIYPIISLDLKSMDEYTSNYDGYVSLFESLPNEAKNYIKDNLGYMIDFKDENVLKELIFITDSDFNPIMDVLFKEDIDVLYVDQKELVDLIIQRKMSTSEFYVAKLKSSINKHNNKYSFFKYLYETYVKEKKISCMIDVYDINEKFPNFSYDDTMIASIATDKDNIMVLCKKLGQSLESRRNLAFKFKKTFNNLNKEGFKLINFLLVDDDKKDNINAKDINDKITENLIKFKKSYEEEYSE